MIYRQVTGEILAAWGKKYSAVITVDGKWQKVNKFSSKITFDGVKENLGLGHEPAGAKTGPPSRCSTFESLGTQKSWKCPKCSGIFGKSCRRSEIQSWLKFRLK